MPAACHRDDRGERRLVHLVSGASAVAPPSATLDDVACGQRLAIATWAARASRRMWKSAPAIVGAVAPGTPRRIARLRLGAGTAPEAVISRTGAQHPPERKVFTLVMRRQITARPCRDVARRGGARNWVEIVQTGYEGQPRASMMRCRAARAGCAPTRRSVSASRTLPRRRICRCRRRHGAANQDSWPSPRSPPQRRKQAIAPLATHAMSRKASVAGYCPVGCGRRNGARWKTIRDTGCAAPPARVRSKRLRESTLRRRHRVSAPPGAPGSIAPAVRCPIAGSRGPGRRARAVGTLSIV